MEPNCLSQPLGRTNTDLEGEELKNRQQETGLGNWLTDLMLGATSAADVALFNSGTLRLNYDLAGGSILRRCHLEQLFGFPVRLVTFEVSGDTLWKAGAHGLNAKGSGAWAHTAGMAKRTDKNGQLTQLLIRRRSTVDSH